MNGVKWDFGVFKRKMELARDAAATAAAMALADQFAKGMGRRHGGVPSEPGGYPNTQTGHLSRSYAWQEADGGIAYAGTNVPYGRWLNDGAPKRNLIARPWARLGIADGKKNMNRAALLALRRSLAK